MALENYFQAEQLIKDNVLTLFDENLIITGVEIGEVSNNDIFADIDADSDKLALLIRQAGFKVDGLHGKRSFKQQRIKFFWQLAVVCPSELYDTYGGLKTIEVMQALMGVKLSADFTEMILIDDERDFNEPEFMKDMAYLPMMFEIQAILNGVKL